MVARIEGGARADADYFVMMGIAAMLASLGLLQGSTAVVIGAMLVAPLMGPLVAAGLALVQGNAQLIRKSITVAAAGIGVALLISILIGLINPGFEPTMELEARGNPDVLDLGIAYASGMAAAYALSRTNVSSTLAGVAIAAALVPPLTVVGIALTNDRPVIAANAGVLLLTNVVCIILGAALTFHLLGARVGQDEELVRPWVRKMLVGMGVTVLVLSVPLIMNMLAVRSIGQARPLSYPVGPSVRDAVDQYLLDWPEVELIALARSSIEPAAGITVLLSTEGALQDRFETELQDVIQSAHRGEPVVRVFALENAISRAGAGDGW
jgi:uncharacterized hydrophobic protein (TIGR00271 family)